MKPKIDLVNMLLVSVDGQVLIPVIKKRKVGEVLPAWCQLKILRCSSQLNGPWRILPQVYIQFFIYILLGFHSHFIVCSGLVWLCLLMLLWAFFSWKKRSINWQWRFYLKSNRWLLGNHCLCNRSGVLIPCQLSWWHLFMPSMNTGLCRLYGWGIRTRSCPYPRPWLGYGCGHL